MNDVAGFTRSFRFAGAHTAAPARIAVAGIGKRFAGVRALDQVSLEVGAGEFFALLGGSGCGKTTLLRIIAGFTAPDSGQVHRDGAEITRVPPAARQMGFVFQSYALFPTMTVRGNIGFALAIRRLDAGAVRRRVEELAALTELGELLERYPHELSGGQQQRVALARALAASPEVLLLDEPLSALDAKIRARLREEIRDIVKRVGATAIYVTHDQEEALAIADRIGVMQAGRLVQTGTPAQVYERPANAFVAGFVGTMNFIPAVVESPGTVRIGRTLVAAADSGDIAPGTRVRAGLRPEHLWLRPAEGGDADGTIAKVTFLGATRRVQVHAAIGELTVDLPCGDPLAAGLHAGAPVAIEFAPRRAVLLGADAAP